MLLYIYSLFEIEMWSELLINVCSALGTWVFSVAGALIAIPVGIKRKSLAPLVFFGTTGTMVDIIMGISQCEREHAERQAKLLEAQNSAPDMSFTETGSESWSQAYIAVCLLFCTVFVGSFCLAWANDIFWISLLATSFPFTFVVVLCLVFHGANLLSKVVCDVTLCCDQPKPQHRWIKI